ncbi:MAG: hypothetical protein Roseis2KO_20710 [Roseivirga sp.]
MFLVFLNCSDDEPAPDLIGLWKINRSESFQVTHYQNGQPLELDCNFSPNSPGGLITTSRLTFEADNSGLYSRDNMCFEDNGNYPFSWEKDMNALTMNLSNGTPENWTIQSLTSAELVVSYEMETTSFPDDAGSLSPRTYQKNTWKYTFIR